MKVLHTSDWHLGQQFYDHSRIEEQKAFLSWLVDTLAAEKIDILLVSGDIFHTATPPAQAEQLLYDFIKSAKSACPAMHIVITAGNHDSPARIETAKPLLSNFDTHVVGRFDKNNPQNVVIQLQIANENAAIIAMPFLRPSDINASQDETARYEKAVQCAYEQACNEIDFSLQPTVLVMGHLHVKGGDISQDSERNLCIGGFDSINSAIFPESASYVALGHLHKSQRVAGKEHIRYCGTPIPMSFAERNYQHQVLALTLEKGKLTSVNPLYTPRTKELILVPERGGLMLGELCEALQAIKREPLTSTPYLRLRMDARETDSQFRVRIDEAMEGLDVHFCGIERVHTEQNLNADAIHEGIEDKALSPLQLLQYAYQSQVDSARDVPKELEKILTELITEMESLEE
ncbi:Exonuclease SbcD [Pseudoalteromonas luteoviolacea B = ATCC 29581]|nr:Exonuclease SbcD [Pseudoalteromonas luteoviolacea B = ATCC 29581]